MNRLGKGEGEAVTGCGISGFVSGHGFSRAARMHIKDVGFRGSLFGQYCGHIDLSLSFLKN
jgi:hypothetical protein